MPAELLGVLPAVDTLPVATFPDHGGADSDAVVCARWRPGDSASGSATTILTGDAVPAPNPPQPLAQADGDGPAVDAVAMAAGRSVFVRSVGLTGAGAGTGPLFLATDWGVLFGIQNTDAATALGLTEAAPGPWPVLALLPRGPDLSRSRASVTTDVIGAAP